MKSGLMLSKRIFQSRIYKFTSIIRMNVAVCVPRALQASATAMINTGQTKYQAENLQVNEDSLTEVWFFQ